MVPTRARCATNRTQYTAAILWTASYLNELQNQEKDRRVIDSVGELKRLSEQMNEMLQAVGQNVIEAQNFQKVVDSQNRILIDFFFI